MDMIEKIARAICLWEGYRYPDEDWTRYTNGAENEAIPDVIVEDGCAQRWRLYERHAIAALRAIEEPTPEMIKAGTIHWDPCDGGPIKAAFDPVKPYRAMIAAALAGTP
jgi:hypothetical protein